MLQDFVLPDLGEGIHEGEILEVHVSSGDQVKEGDVILVIETDKAAVEIPSPYTGAVHNVLVRPHDVVHVGKVMVVFEIAGAEDIKEKFPPKGEKQSAEKKEETKPSQVIEGTGPVPASPATRKLARELGVDLHKVRGSGSGGLVTADDVKVFAQQQAEPEIKEEHPVAFQQDAALSAAPAYPVLPDFSEVGPVERISLPPIRKIIARKMALSWSQIPHVSHQEQVDITELDKIRKQNKSEVQAHGGKLTITIFALKAAVAALEAFPRFNSSLDAEKEEVIIKKYYHIGVATDTERGLVVPVIRDVNHKDMLELSRELLQLTERARQGKLTLQETTGGSFTITNIGSIGGSGFQPIINYPEVAILGLGKARWQQVVCPGRNGDFISEPRLMLPVVLSFDHRVLDGAEAARFVNDIKETLERPSRILFFEQ